MKITALEEYGLRCMVLFAHQKRSESLTLNDISERENISVPYAAKLLMILRKARLVTASCGRRGGYRLTRPSERIKLQEIMRALGEPLFGPHHCRRYAGDGEECVHIEDCPVERIWNAFDRYINDIFGKVTLAQLAAGNFGAGRILDRGQSGAESSEIPLGRMTVNENKGRL